MKIYTIISEGVENATQLSSSFNIEQWSSIFGFFANQNNINLGDRREIIRRRFATLNDNIGANMPNYINEFDWLRKAKRYGLTQGLPSEATFEQIYQHLRQGMTFDLNQLENWDDTTPPAAAAADYPNTPESYAEFTALVVAQHSQLIQNGNVIDRDGVIAYVKMMEQVVLTRRNDEWERKLNWELQSGVETAIKTTLRNQLRQQILPNLPVDYQQLIRVYYSWLQRADITFSNPEYAKE